MEQYVVILDIGTK